MGNVAVRDKIKNYLTKDEIQALRNADSVSFSMGNLEIVFRKMVIFRLITKLRDMG